ncbi:mitochondrial amidoxime reducing component 2-like [Haematobia irritans]|uniref:mitochondrial amidoxime reducing component 2-like n=1 Tax=Haematobia irritans TaxID=7368 RepID=UPI003F500317
MGYRPTACIVATVGLVTISVVFLIYRRRQRQHGKILPSNPNWEHIGTVKEMALYPIQSAGSLVIPKAKCEKFGISVHGIRDRSFVLLNESDEPAFSGTFPSMLAITTEILNESSLVIHAPNREALSLDLYHVTEDKPILEKKRNGFTMRLIECDPIHHKWFSNLILQRDIGLKLYIALEPEIELNMFGKDKSDFNAIMIMNDKSVNDLNSRLAHTTKVHHLQFRGNLLLNCGDNVKPYDEDNWQWLKIGDTEEACIFQYKAPCVRCISPNVDIHTCKHNPHFEPLKTLKSYRLVHNSKEPTMGAYYTIFKEGSIEQNDNVYAIVANK